MVRTFRRLLTEAKMNSLPPILKTEDEVLKTYPKECQILYDDFLKSDWYKRLTDEAQKKLTLKSYIKDLLPDISASNIVLTDDMIRIADENKETIFKQLKKREVNKECQILYFWKTFDIWYDHQKDKIKREEAKKAEQEEK